MGYLGDFASRFRAAGALRCRRSGFRSTPFPGLEVYGRRLDRQIGEIYTFVVTQCLGFSICSPSLWTLVYEKKK